MGTKGLCDRVQIDKGWDMSSMIGTNDPGTYGHWSYATYCHKKSMLVM